MSQEDSSTRLSVVGLTNGPGERGCSTREAQARTRSVLRRPESGICSPEPVTCRYTMLHLEKVPRSRSLSWTYFVEHCTELYTFSVLSRISRCFTSLRWRGILERVREAGLDTSCALYQKVPSFRCYPIHTGSIFLSENHKEPLSGALSPGIQLLHPVLPQFWVYIVAHCSVAITSFRECSLIWNYKELPV